MGINFTIKDILHEVSAKFVRTFLPTAKEAYNLRAVHQPEVDIHGIASKAEVYNTGISPKVIEEGLAAGIKIMFYLAADGYKIKTPLFTLKLHIPGEYDGTEERLPDGVRPEVRLQPSREIEAYIKKNVTIVIDGKLDCGGLIAEAVDETTGRTNEAATIGGVLTVRGHGLKIESDEAHRDHAGLFFADPDGGLTRAKVMVNEPLTLKAIVPPDLTAGAAYTLVVVTQSSARKSGHVLQEPHEARSRFALTIQA
jgi:hypothetical protein